MRALSTSNSRFTKRLVLFFAVLGLVIAGAMILADRLDDDVNDIKSLWQDIYLAEPDSVDIVFLGSSHANSTFVPEVFDDITGKTSFNLGSSNQTPETGYYFFKEFLKEQRPQILVQEVYWDVMTATVETTAVNTQHLLNMHPGVNWAGIFMNTFTRGEKETFLIKGLNPFYRLKGIALRHLASRPATVGDAQPSVQYWGRGYRPYLITADGSRKEEVIDRLSKFNGYSSEQLAYLQKTIDLAESQDMEVLLVMAPIMPDVINALIYYEKVEQVTNDIAQDRGLNFVDFNRLNQNGTLVLPLDCFGDEHHVNDKGARIVSTYLAEYITSSL